VKDGASGGERVGGGAGGSGDDHPVRLEGGDELAIEADLVVRRCGPGSLVDDHVVEDLVLDDDLART
jgi:hypothetical protein